MTPSVLWITGARGLIGSHLLRQAAQLFPQSRIIPVARPELDLTDFAAVEARFTAERPDAVIHCAALSRSPACQAQPALAHRINVEVTRHLAQLGAGVPLVFFSTDLVFDGRRGGYREADPLNPLLVYGETKAEAERWVLTNPRHLVVRTSLNYGHSPTGDRAFNEEMVNAWRAGRTLQLFTDEFRSPIAATETAAAVLGLLQAGATGIFHVAGSERLSRWGLGQLIAEQHPEANPKICPSSLKDFQGAPTCRCDIGLVEIRSSPWQALAPVHRLASIPILSTMDH